MKNKNNTSVLYHSNLDFKKKLIIQLGEKQLCTKSEKSNFLLCAATLVMVGSGNRKAGKLQVNPIIDIHFYPSAKQR